MCVCIYVCVCQTVSVSPSVGLSVRLSVYLYVFLSSIITLTKTSHHWLFIRPDIYILHSGHTSPFLVIQTHTTPYSNLFLSTPPSPHHSLLKHLPFYSPSASIARICSATLAVTHYIIVHKLIQHPHPISRSGVSLVFSRTAFFLSSDVSSLATS